MEVVDDIISGGGRMYLNISACIIESWANLLVASVVNLNIVLNLFVSFLPSRTSINSLEHTVRGSDISPNTTLKRSLDSW